MKFTSKAAHSQEAVAELLKIVSRHGSILRSVPQETDIGIDAFIECVRGEEATADLIAVQIKGGASFEREKGNCFRVRTNLRHLDYWNNLLMPVLLVCYSPDRGLCWTSVHGATEAARYRGETLDYIDVPYANALTPQALDEISVTLTLKYRHQFALLKFIDQAFDDDSQRRFEAIDMICKHPSARYSPTAAAMARRLLADTSEQVVRKAAWFLGYCTGRMRWSFNPGNAEEGEISEHAAKLCKDIDSALFRRLFDACWEGDLTGPYSLPERLADISASCVDSATDALLGIASDQSEPLERRQVALFVAFGCSHDEACERIEGGNELAQELLGAWYDFVKPKTAADN